MKITIIGAGNMGGAAALGFARFGAAAADDITVTARHQSSLDKFKESGFSTSTDNNSAVCGADIVFIAVKPWQIEEVLKGLRPSLDPDRQMVVSIAPGVKPEQLTEWLSLDGKVPAIAYAIPNTAIEIGESMTFIASVTASESQVGTVKSLFDKVGESCVVPVGSILAGTSLASCGIAYAMRYISASVSGGQQLGLDQIDIEKAVCQTVKGAADLIREKGSKPEEEINKVTTPNGLTIRGLEAMEANRFSESVMSGLTVVSRKRGKRVVVKVGTRVLTRADGSLDTTRVSAIVDQITDLKGKGFDIVLVTSGAVACGRSLVKKDRKLNEVEQRQLYSAVGQVRLMDLYYKLFIEYGINVGQVLTMKENFSSEIEYNNQRNCMEVMLQSGVLPIVNENDTVSITELMFTDNDELSALVAEMIGAERMVILIDGEGESKGNPDIPDAAAIQRATQGGIRVTVADGKKDGIIVDVLTKD